MQWIINGFYHHHEYRVCICVTKVFWEFGVFQSYNVKSFGTQKQVAGRANTFTDHEFLIEKKTW